MHIFHLPLKDLVLKRSLLAVTQLHKQSGDLETKTGGAGQANFSRGETPLTANAFRAWQ